MSKPDDIPEGVWLTAQNALDRPIEEREERIARALIAAKLEAYQEAAKVAADFVDGRLYKPKFPACSYHAGEIYEAIKSLGNAG